jgi:hypothetical protein
MVAVEENALLKASLPELVTTPRSFSISVAYDFPALAIDELKP